MRKEEGRVVYSVNLNLFYVAGWKGPGTEDGGGVFFVWKEGGARGLYGALKICYS